VVSVADLHGDFQHTVALLRAAGLVEEVNDANLQAPDGRPFTHYRGARWIGGNATLVQTGDLVDRGAFGRDLYALFSDLRQQAAAAGGRVVNLIGNHDMMNLHGDLRYVSRQDTAEFGSSAARRKAFATTGWVGRQILEEFLVAFFIRGTLFVHAGLLPEHVERGIGDLNEAFRAELKASLSSWTGFRSALLQATGPVWLRRLTVGSEDSACPQVQRVLELTGAQRMVVGHTQVDEGAVRSRCNGRLLMADTIISRDGYPECWEQRSMQVRGCRGALSYIELRGPDAVAVSVPSPEAPIASVLERPLPIIASDMGEEL